MSDEDQTLESEEVWRQKMRRKLWCDLAMNRSWVESNPMSPLPAAKDPLDRAEKAILRFDKLFPAPETNDRGLNSTSLTQTI